MKLWSFKPTEFLGVGCRLAAGLAVCTYVGYFLFVGHEELDNHFKTLIRTFFKWAAVTVVVTTQPLTGRVAEICVQRVIGTVAGGCVGFLVAIFAARLDILEDEIFMTCVSSCVGFIGAYLGWLLKLETSARLFTMTYLLVAYGVDKSSAAEEVAITRTGGIVTGVLVSMTMSVLVFPNSATDEAVEKMRKAVGQLGKLNELAWAHAELAQNPSLMQIIGSVEAVVKPLKPKNQSSDPLKQPLLGDDAAMTDDKVEEGRTTREVDILQKAAEGVLAGIYKDLDSSEGLLAAAKQEIMVPMWHGRWCFLPGNPFCTYPGQWVLPKEELQEFSTTLRRVARLIWTLHTTFVEGFDETMAAVLEKQYPKPLFPLLIKYSTDFVNDVVGCFPYKLDVPENNLIQFERCVEALHYVSDYQRRRIIKALKYYKKKASLRRSTTLASRGRAASQDGYSTPGQHRVGSGTATPSSSGKGGILGAAQSLADQCLPGMSVPRQVNVPRQFSTLVLDGSPMASPPNRQLSFTRTTPGSSPTAILHRLRDLTAIDIQPPTPTNSEFTETPRSRQPSFSYGGGPYWPRYRPPQDYAGSEQYNLARRSYSITSEQGDGNQSQMPDDSYGSLARRSYSAYSEPGDNSLSRLSQQRRSGDYDEMFEQELGSPSKIAEDKVNSSFTRGLTYTEESVHYSQPNGTSPTMQPVPHMPAKSPSPFSSAAGDNPSTLPTYSDTTPVRETSADQASPGQAFVVSTSVAQTPAGQSPSGQTSTGQPATGQTSTGQPATGQTSAGQTSAGQTSAGQTSAGQTSAGHTSAGQTSAGQTSAGQTSAGQTSTGQTSASQTSTGQTSTGQTSAGQTFVGQLVTPSTSFHLQDVLSPTPKTSTGQLPPLPPPQRPVSPPGLNPVATPDASPSTDLNVFLRKAQQPADSTTKSPQNAHPGTGSSPVTSAGVLSPREVLIQQLTASLSTSREPASLAEQPSAPSDLPPIPEDKSYADLTLLHKLHSEKPADGVTDTQILNALANVVQTKHSVAAAAFPADSSPSTSDDMPPVPQPLDSALKWTLPRASSLEVSLHVMFPDTEEGYIAKVRWYSFQFLMEELADEFRNLYSAMLRLTPKLPHHKKKRRKP